MIFRSTLLKRYVETPYVWQKTKYFWEAGGALISLIAESQITFLALTKRHWEIKFRGFRCVEVFRDIDLMNNANFWQTLQVVNGGYSTLYCSSFSILKKHGSKWLFHGRKTLARYPLAATMSSKWHWGFPAKTTYNTTEGQELWHNGGQYGR